MNNKSIKGQTKRETLNNMTVCNYITFADIKVFEEVDRNYAFMCILFCMYVCIHFYFLVLHILFTNKIALM